MSKNKHNNIIYSSAVLRSFIDYRASEVDTFSVSVALGAFTTVKSNSCICKSLKTCFESTELG
jgi:hypothetical protein